MRRPGVVFTREQLLSEVWGYAATAGGRTVDVHVAQLRAKLGAASPIRTVRSVGYAAGGDRPHRDRRPRHALATDRLLAVGVAVLTALLAGLLAVGLTRTSADDSAGSTLARIADAAAARADRERPPAPRRTGPCAPWAPWASSPQRGPGPAPYVDEPPRPRRPDPGPPAELLAATVSAVTTSAAPRSSSRAGRRRRRHRPRAAPVRRDRRLRPARAAGPDRPRHRRGRRGGRQHRVARRLARPLRRTADAAHALAAGRARRGGAGRGARRGRRGRERPQLPVRARCRGPRAGSATSSSRCRTTCARRSPASAATPSHSRAASCHPMTPPVSAASSSPRRKRLERLVGDLLDLARLGAGPAELAPEPTDLVALGREVESVWSRRCAAVGVRSPSSRPGRGLVGHRPGPGAPARRRPARERPAGHAGRPPDRRRGAPRGRAGRVVVEVRDGGPGLTDDDLSVAFEPSVLHERYRGVRPVGTGLGLAIVGRLAQVLGGDGRGRARARGRRPLHPAPPHPPPS